MKGQYMKYKKVVKNAIKFSLVVGIGLGCVSAGQIAQHVASTEDSRMHAIALWNEKNPTLNSLSQSFINECMNRTRDSEKEIDLEKELKKPVSIYECGNKLGAEDLMIEIKKSDDSIKSFAWPLSILDT